MAVPARDIAAALRDRLPGVGIKKLHKLLYYCQGHHLATFGKPLFAETISAWDMGPVVGTFWREEKDDAPSESVGARSDDLGEAELNTVGYIVSRYGGLTGTDLEHLTHSETPWIEANKRREPGGSAPIRNAVIEDYFRHDADDDDEPRLDPKVISAWLANVETPPEPDPSEPDEFDQLVKMRDEILARPARG